jgi:hypothetical protein
MVGGVKGGGLGLPEVQAARVVATVAARAAVASRLNIEDLRGPTLDY